MSSEKPRRWFQLHLSTGIVLMFVAGGLMWLNNVPGMFNVWKLSPEEVDHWSNAISTYRQHDIGWPWVIFDTEILHNDDGTRTYYQHNMSSSKLRIYANVLINMLMLSVTVYLLEWRIRRAKSNLTQAHEEA